MGDEAQQYNREDRVKVVNKFNKSVFKNVYRSKGPIYVSSQIDGMFSWQTAGMVNEIKHIGKWLASGTKKQLFKEGFQEEYNAWTDKVQGDRKTQLVIIGSGLDRKGITKCLDDCLVSEEEYAKMKKADKIEAMEWVHEEEEDPFRPIDKEEDEEEWVDED